MTALSQWFDNGIAKNAKYMVIFRDTWDYEDYPMYFYRNDSANYAIENPSSMQRVMGVYDLKMDKDRQFKDYKTYNPPRKV